MLRSQVQSHASAPHLRRAPHCRARPAQTHRGNHCFRSARQVLTDGDRLCMGRRVLLGGMMTWKLIMPCLHDALEPYLHDS